MSSQRITANPVSLAMTGPVRTAILSLVFGCVAFSGANSQEIRILSLATNRITYTTTVTNLWTQVQIRWSLQTSDYPWYREAWHTFLTEGDPLMRTHTNVMTFSGAELDQLTAMGHGALFFRVAGASTPVPTTTTPMEMIATNVSSVTMTEIVITLGGAQGSFHTNSLAAGDGSSPFLFALEDAWLGSLESGRCFVSLSEAGQPRNYSFYPGAQRFTVALSNGTYSLINRDANNGIQATR